MPTGSGRAGLATPAGRGSRNNAAVTSAAVRGAEVTEYTAPTIAIRFLFA
ncbi:MAG TPA: hypothetical protein VH092_18695 [Urbifossiella sp.]|nr:hypothetical protein [Urbifossiella sp.]